MNYLLIWRAGDARRGAIYLDAAEAESHRADVAGSGVVSDVQVLELAALDVSRLAPRPSPHLPAEERAAIEKAVGAVLIGDATGLQLANHIDRLLEVLDAQTELHDRAEAALGEQVTALERRPRVCVAGLITNGDRLLLVRSRKRGGWELPGGRQEPGDADWRAAVRREVLEEAGVHAGLDAGPPFAVLDGRAVSGAAYASVILVARGTSARRTPTAGDDAAEARWFSREEVADLELSAIQTAEVVRKWVAEEPTERAEDK